MPRILCDVFMDGDGRMVFLAAEAKEAMKPPLVARTLGLSRLTTTTNSGGGLPMPNPLRDSPPRSVVSDLLTPPQRELYLRNARFKAGVDVLVFDFVPIFLAGLETKSRDEAESLG